MKKLLLVDDGRDLLEIYTKSLKHKGFSEIRFAYNGKEALEKILEDKPDIILVDVIMPVMDGYELCKQIRANPEMNDIYIIASSCSGKGLPKGMKDYVDEILPKEDIGKIIARLEELLGGK